VNSGVFDAIFHLPVTERLQIAEALWDSIVESAEAESVLALSDEERAELQRRLDEHDRDPGSAVPWEKVRRKLLAGQ